MSESEAKEHAAETERRPWRNIWLLGGTSFFTGLSSDMPYARRGPLVKNVLRAYLEAGGKGVVVGTDSHRLWQFDGGWQRTLAYLERAGTKEVALFRNRHGRIECL